MKRLPILFCIILSMSVWCLAENFLVKKRPRKTAQQVKQELVQLMSDLVELKSRAIELEAQVQQRLCQDIRQSLDGSKKSVRSLKQLQELLISFSAERERLLAHARSQKRLLSTIG